MYVDRKLAGLQAVQTLSRLNRTYPGKERTFVLDFQNTIEDMQTAFRPFFEVTALEANSDPNQVYELEARLKTSASSTRDEIDRFAETFFKGHSTRTIARASKDWCDTLSAASNKKMTKGARKSSGSS